MDNLLDGLRGLLDASAILTDPADQAPFLRDWHGRNHGQARCTVLPRTTAEVAAVVSLCVRLGVPVFPQGGNTSVNIGSIPSADGRGIVLSLNRMNRVLAVERTANAMIVEAGCVLAAVHEAATSVDRIFPLTLGAQGSCQIGGNIATNAGGTAVLRYGNMRDLVLGLEVVLPDGRVWDGLKTLRKDNTGYDLKQMFIGAEGTLGIITAAALKLFPRPHDVAVAWVAVPDPGHAVTLLSALQDRFDAAITAFELISGSLAEIVVRYVPNTRRPLAEPHPWQILIELSDVNADARLAERLETALSAAMEQGLVVDAIVARSEQQRQALWHVRHGVTEANRTHGMNITHDIAVPVDQVPAYFERAHPAIEARFPQAELLSVTHLGDGNIHYTVTFPFAAWQAHPDPASLREAVSTVVHELAIELGGTFIAEHGVGQRHKAALLRYKSAVGIDLLHIIKQAVDPLGLMNPGKLLPDR